MNAKPCDFPWPDPDFDENRRNFSPEELAKYEGQHVAWSWDGSRIVASGADIDEVEERLIAAGIDPSRVVHSYVVPGNVSLF